MFGTRLALIKAMSTNNSNGNQQTVSQIVRVINKDGQNVLGFTVYHGENSFYNVMRSFSDDDYDEVYQSLTEQRKHLLDNQNTKEKK